MNKCFISSVSFSLFFSSTLGPFYIRNLVLRQEGCRHKHTIFLDVIFLKIRDDEHVMHHMYIFLVNKMLFG